jgi:hypothetical protein|nr:MAG TPA: homing endonuclease [Caudoviricetes sp.]
MGNQQVRPENLYKITILGNYYHDGKGNIYSTVRSTIPKKLALIPHGGKTKKVYFRVKIKNRLWMVHHLVLMQKYGRFLEKGESGNHLDGNTQNNSPENLEISTHAEQVAHAVQTGLYCSGNEWRKARGLLINR